MKQLKLGLSLLIILIQAGFVTVLKAENVATQQIDLSAEINTTLNHQQQYIVVISALTARGDLEKLKPQLNAALDAGLTVNQIKETMVHLYAYSGFPRSLQGLRTFILVLEERKARGIVDNMGVKASPIIDSRPKYERGKAILETLLQRKLDGPKADYAEFSPEIEVFLKEHLFADIFERDVLTYQQRELVTISVLSSLGGLEPMLRSHLVICLNLGLTAEQLQHFVKVMTEMVGEQEASAAQVVLDEVLKNRS